MWPGNYSTSSFDGYIIEYGGLAETYSVTSSLPSVNEGQSVIFSIATNNVLWGTDLSYTLSGISGADVVGGLLTGSAKVGLDGLATFTINVVTDHLTEGLETLTATVQGQSASVTVNDTSISPTVNHAPTGSVTLTGTPTQGYTMTANNTLADADGMGVIHYQWQVASADIGGATGSAFVLTAAEVGKAITVVANYVDGQGTAESVISTAVTVDGASATPVLFAGNGHYYQWVSSRSITASAALDTASKTSFNGLQGYLATITSGDENSFIQTLMQQVPPALRGLMHFAASDARVDGVWKWLAGPEVGQVLSYFAWDPASGEPNGYFNGLREDYAASTGANWVDLPDGPYNGVGGYLVEYGGMPASYAITADSVAVNEGASVAFSISTTNVEWGAALAYSLTGIAAADVVGGVMTGIATVGTDGKASFTVTLVTDHLTEGLETLTATVQGQSASVTVNDTSISPTVNHAPTGSVTLTGTPTQGQTLTATNTLADADGLGVIHYQWKAAGTDISGATSSAFVLTAAQVGKAITVTANYTDGHNTIETVSSAATATVDTGAAALHGIVYQWKSHMLLDGVSLAATGGGHPAEGANAPLQFKNLTWDAAGHASVDIYAHAALAFQDASLELGLGASTGVVFTVDAALPSDWSMLSNIDPANGHLLVAGFGLSNAIAAGDVKLGTVTFETGAMDHAAVQLVSGAVGDALSSSYGMAVARDITDAQGGFTLSELMPGTNSLMASRATTDSGSAITSADALAALRIAVGLNPNPDPDGTGPLTALPVSPYQFIAADVVGTDGRITSADALAILRMAVKLPTAPAKEWLFVEETRDFWDEATGKFTLDRTHASWDHAISANLQSDQTLNLVGVLKGDVNGSWAAPTGSVDLDVISPQYFQTLHDQLGLPAAQFGVYP